MTIRTDLADSGIYICKYWILKLLEDLDKDHEIEYTSIEDELIPFLALNQFKKKLAKYIVKPKHEPKLGLSTSSYHAKINMIMNPKQLVNKDVVKLAAFIDAEKDNYFQKFHNLKYYMAANQDAQRLLYKCPIFTPNIFAPTADLLIQHRSIIEENKKNKVPYYEGLPPVIKQVSLDSSVLKDIEIGEKANVSKSSIGRGVKIGAKSKIVNSVILNHVTIGNE